MTASTPGSVSPDGGGWVENRAPSGRRRLDLAEIWRYRELAFFFAARDVKVRYKQALLGAAWAVLQPLAGAVTFTILFNGLADIDVDGDSYFAFSLVGFVAWTYVSTAIGSGATSVVANSDLLTKVYFPPIVAPLSTLLPPAIDLAIGAVLAVAVAVVVGGGLSLVGVVVGLPLGAALLVAAAAGPVLFFSALTVRYRDARVLAGFGLQILLFASPVAYPAEIVPDRWQLLYHVNPIAGALGCLRSALIGDPLPDATHLLASVAVAVAITTAGLVRFRSSEPTFADII